MNLALRLSPSAASLVLVLLPFGLLPVGLAPVDDPPPLDFSKPELPAGWTISSASNSWKIAGGELRGEGSGTLEWTRPVAGDFTLTFDARTAEKANVEVKLLDATGKKELYTFAFLGQYHPALDGVKTCILKGDQFVKINPRMWIFPGRTFNFELRAAKRQFQMFLSGELGPVFADAEPDAAIDGGVRFRIVVATEGKRDEVRLDNVKIVGRR